MKWFRLYDDLVFNAKAQSLPPKLFKHWMNLLCLASRNNPRGYLPSLDRIAFALRMKPDRVSVVLQMLSDRGFIEKDNLIHDWNETQRESDDSAIRKQASRIKILDENVTRQSHKNPASDTDTEQIQTQSRTDTEKSTAVDEDFEEFWANSSKRGSKKEALAEWKKISKEKRESGTIQSGMLAWLASWQWQDETKQPHIVRWLRREGWTEEIPKHGGNGNGIPHNESASERRIRKAAEVCDSIRNGLNAADSQGFADDGAVQGFRGLIRLGSERSD